MAHFEMTAVSCTAEGQLLAGPSHPAVFQRRVRSPQLAVGLERRKTLTVYTPTTAHAYNPCKEPARMGPSSRGHTSGIRGIFAGAVGGSIGMGAHGGTFGVSPARADKGPLSPGQGNMPWDMAAVPVVKGTRRVLIIMSDTGGGHRASAEALKATFEELYGGKFRVYVEDIWKKFTKWPVSTFGDSYNFMVKHSFIWRIGFRLTEPWWLHRPWLRTINCYTGNTLGKMFEVYKPHLVVSVHPLMQQVPLRCLKLRVKQGLMQDIPFATVVTDLTSCHPLWMHKDVTKCFVPTDEVKDIALRAGLQEHQIVKHGLPIRPQFSQARASKRALRKKLHMDPDAPTVLVAGGGEGMGALEVTTEALAAELGPNCQVVLICGRNQKLANSLRAKEWPMKVIVNGFVTNMSDWMGACDAIITKAGPGTIAEALISGLPILLNGCVPCQEEGNIPYVLENGVGAFERNPAKIAKIIAHWFGPGREELKQMSARAAAMGRANATAMIVRDLADLAQNVPEGRPSIAPKMLPAAA